MTDPGLVPLERGRSVVTGLTLPDPPPTRVYISGRLYRLAPSPQIPLPPIANVVKVVTNWLGPAGRIAKNVWYILTGGGFVSSDPVSLKTLADQLMTQATAAGITQTVHSSWKLQSFTCKDAGGTTASATSTVAQINGIAAGNVMPPSVAMCASFQIAESYRGGKPRWYMPGVPDTGLVTAGDSAISASFAGLLESHMTTFMNDVNGIATSPSGTFKMGTVSYHTAHSVRPTPLFRQFINVKVHERLDSQRRRSGSESLFGVIP